MTATQTTVSPPRPPNHLDDTRACAFRHTLGEDPLHSASAHGSFAD